MRSSARSFSPSEAAARLGVSVKALRLYEEQGLIAPVRTAAGWRAYGPQAMARAAEIVALRAVGLGLADIASVLAGEAQALAPTLARHQAVLEDRIRDLARAVAKVRELRSGLAQANVPPPGGLERSTPRSTGLRVAFDLPWPWGGERFELRDVRALTYVVGPLGSGKTRLARRLAETLPGAAFLGLDRSADGGAAVRSRLDADPSLKTRVERTLGRLAEDGAAVSEALVALLAGLEAEGSAALVVDLVEQGLDRATQAALAAHLRRRGATGRPLFLLTRSCVILDLAAVGPNETIILCPANHSPPIPVDPCPGAPGYEAVATCLAPPEVRARTEGVVAWRPQAA